MIRICILYNRLFLVLYFILPICLVLMAEAGNHLLSPTTGGGEKEGGRGWELVVTVAKLGII